MKKNIHIPNNSSPAEIRGTKIHYGARKSLGQHFLTAKGVVNDIVRAAEIKNGEIALEIGPGKGILTGALLSAGAKVIAVEKDLRFIALLEEKFKTAISDERLAISNEDVLEFDPKRCLLNAKRFKLVANIPYYITGEILRKFIGGELKPSRAVLLVQKEVAERIAAKNGKESILSISVKVFGNPKYVKKVPAKYFNPAPKVDSAILLIENINTAFAGEREQAKFFEVVKTGFAHKRKMLVGNLSGLLGKEKTADILAACGVPKNARAENLKLEHWVCLAKNLR